MAKIKKKAAASRRNAQEELKSIAHGISDLYHVHQKQFNIGFLAAAVLVAVVVIYTQVKANQERSAGALFEKAYASFRDATDAGPNYEKALQEFQEVVKQYGSTMNGAIAQFYIGNTYAQTGRPDDALKAYQEFVNRYNGEKFLLALVYQRMGYVYASLGKTEDAMKSFVQAETTSGPGVATLELARLYERSGKTKEAMDKYKELSEKLPGTTWALAARSKLPPPAIAAPATATVGTAAK